ncbi:MAG: hypothetical protein IJ991_09480, partial [Thermoguttaceae bacterium]|nr:hypothetical protein [Thermoguttaceae bacterium]
NFIVGDAVDASFEFDVAAPLAFESETAPTAADATAFVVWRGRWELLTAPAESSLAVWVRNAEESDEDYFKATKFRFVGALSVIDVGNEVANVTYTANDKVELFGGVPTAPTSEFTSVGGPVHYYDENCFGLIKKINAGKTAYCLTAKAPKIKKADVSSASYITELVTDVSLNADGTLNVVKTPVQLVF